MYEFWRNDKLDANLPSNGWTKGVTLDENIPGQIVPGHASDGTILKPEFRYNQFGPHESRRRKLFVVSRSTNRAGDWQEEKIDWLEITWPPPGGTVQRFTELPIDRYITIVEGQEKLRIESRAAFFKNSGAGDTL